MNRPDVSPIIDSHCHLDRFHRRGELDSILARAAAAGVTRMITIGTGPDDWDLYRDIHRAHPSRVAYTVGLHPSEVGVDWESAVARIEPFFSPNTLPASHPVGIGEIGLDYFRLPSDPTLRAETIALQKSAFAAQLQIAARLDTPIVIHSRSAHDDCLEMILNSPVNPARCVFHCFSGTVDQALQLDAHDISISITGIITFKSATTLREVAHALGPDRLMVETDCPYLAPEPHRGEENEPAHTRLISDYLANLLEIPDDDFADRTRRRTESFFHLPPI